MDESLLSASLLDLKVYKRQYIRFALVSILIILILGTIIVSQKVDQLKTDLVSLQHQLTRDENTYNNTYDKLQTTLDNAEEAQKEVENNSKSALKSIVCSEANYYNNKTQTALNKYEQYLNNAEEYLKEYKKQQEEVNDLVKKINQIQEKLMMDKKYFTKSSLNGYTKESEKITTLKNAKVKEKATEAQKYADKLYNEYLYIMLRIVTGEAGSEYCPDLDQFYVMAVIENRIKHPEFPNTLSGVVFQPGQYQPTWDGSWSKKADKRTQENVAKYLRGKVDINMPDNIVYQAMFKQGDYVWAYVANPVDGGHFYCGLKEK